MCSLCLARDGEKRVPLDEFARERAIGAGAGSTRVVLKNRFSEARRFT